MAEVDTSSYPKLNPNPLQGVIGLQQVQQGEQQIERNRISIDQAKLGLFMQHQENLIKTLNSLPLDATQDEYLKWGRQAVKEKITTPEQFAEYASGMPKPTGNPIKDKENLLRHRQITATRLLGTVEQIQHVYGTPGIREGAQADVPTRTSPFTGIQPAGQPIQRQPSIDTDVATPEGVQKLGPQAPQIPQGAQPVQGGFPGQYSLPTIGPAVAHPAAPQAPRALPVGPIDNLAIPGPSSNFGGNVLGASVEAPTPNQQVQNRFVPQGPMASQPPMFDAGKQMLVADQQEASQRMMRIKPAAQALELMQKPGMLSGPLSEQFTQGAAALKTFGLIPSDMNDPTAIRQEVAKKLAQYVSGNPVGQRSDSAQILAEASSPNPKTQTLQALTKLTKDAIVLDRVQAAMPNAFKDKDLSKYGNHKSLFPQSIDERAFGLDMEKDRGASLVDTMAKRLQKNKEDREATKFFNSLRIARDQGFYSKEQ